jgi:hypothetical protein
MVTTALQSAKLEVARILLDAKDKLWSVRSSICIGRSDNHLLEEASDRIDKVLAKILPTNERPSDG